MEQSINTVFEEPEKGSLDRIEPYPDKGNFISSKRERSFLRKFFLICEFISRTYNLDFRKEFPNTGVVDSEKVYWELIEGSGEKGNILT